MENYFEEMMMEENRVNEYDDICDADESGYDDAEFDVIDIDDIETNEEDAVDDKIIITKHAYKRMKERNGWSRKTADRMVPRVLEQGLRPNEVKGYLKGWVKYKANSSKCGNIYILYSEKLYVFSDKIMLTVVPVPTRRDLIKEAC